MKLTDDNNTPLLSIVIAVYNIENYIKECLDSILCQDYTDYEIIAVDDGSTDLSGDICDRYSCDRLRVIHTDNRGVSAARNAGLAVSRGRYVLFVDGDDVMIRGALKKIMLGVISSDAMITTFHLDAFDNETGTEIDLNYGYNANIIRSGKKSEIINELLCHECVPWGTGVNVFSADFLKRNNITFSDGAHGVEDCCFFLDAVKACNSFHYISMPLIRYRMNRQGSIMNTPSLIKLEARARVYGEWISYANELIAYNGFGGGIRVRMGDAFFYNVLQLYNQLDSNDIFFNVVNDHKDILKYCTGMKKRIIYMMIRIFGAKTALSIAVRGRYKK